MRSFFCCVSVSCFSVVAAPVFAADLQVQSKIDAVTVSPDAAQVTRLADIDVPAGATTLVFKGLPAMIDPTSLRVSGVSGAKILIGAVDSRLAIPEVKPADASFDVKLKTLRSERESVQVTLDALETKRAMIAKFAQSDSAKSPADINSFDADKWNEAWDAVGVAMAKVGEDLHNAKVKARDLDEEIGTVEFNRQKPTQQGEPARDVSVAIEADAPTKGQITLSYRIASAGWRPVYDARLDTGDQTKPPALELVRRAAVNQSTHEDWTDVALTVSTVRTNRGTDAPDVQPTKLDFLAVPEVMSDTAAAKAAPSAAQAPAPMPGVPARVPGAGAVNAGARVQLPMVEVGSSLDSNAYQAVFHIPGRVTVPADGTLKSFMTGTLTLSPGLMLVTSPAFDQTAYLQAQFKNDESVPLLAGPVAIYRDNGFVGTGQFTATAPGDDVTLGFGADDRVKIVRITLKRKENDAGWSSNAQNKVDSREFKTTLKNLHEFPVRVLVTDQMPFAENAAIKIEQVATTPPPNAKDVNDKRGVMNWQIDLAPGEQKEIHLAYRMKWPADRDVVFEPVPQAGSVQ
ncbi:mucoidy inhibitor MuiA family protein [Methylovirgula sp. 4M-Z18]|uniref:mucoidy inhibitor MuiA family protein n=1 Tax=Methylovirgula sp. 4M-Z18 TaxID=2293567 RepID=UPI000E2F0950|nr:mucoidy inhibitor MuiA family protein [Methylovirgula sp. 4M-Z18]RFB78256.1 mucoidy inhibitor MuiA family protein [Methylovirgula sp. 4M-Z18]